MHDLLFTLPGDEYPFRREVRVAFDPAVSVYEFTLCGRAPGAYLHEPSEPGRAPQTGLITADRAFEATAPQVLDAFLMQLVAD